MWQDRSSRRTQSQPGLVLALSRQCLAGRRRLALVLGAENHLTVGLPQIDYMGEHWLASFAVPAFGDED
jgi:hypothetical protein